MCKYSQSLADKIVGILLDGNYVTTACASVGISKVTFYNWKKLAEDGKQPYKKLFERIEEAEAIAEASLVQDIKLDEDWQAKAWMLERKHPDKWGKKDHLYLSMNKKTNEELLAIIRGENSTGDISDTD